MSYSHRNTNVNYLKTYQTLSSASKNNAKIANTPNYYMTQTSFKNQIKAHTMQRIQIINLKLLYQDYNALVIKDYKPFKKEN